MANSGLVEYTNISPNTYGLRKHEIDIIVIHCYVGQVSLKNGTDTFSRKGYKYSCNYLMSKEGKTGLVLPEEYASICTCSKSVDNRAITIETASDNFAPYKITNDALKGLIYLCADICKRNGKVKAVWISDKVKNKAYVPKAGEMLFSAHRFYANKSCPGDYIFGLMPTIVERINEILAGKTPTNIPTPTTVTPAVVPSSANTPTPKSTLPSAFDYSNLTYGGVDMKPVFDASFYYRNYPDLQKNVGPVLNKLFYHFCTTGMREARQGIATFNPVTYKANYSDLANAYGNDWVKYYQHYLLFGIKEGRKGC